MKSPSRLWPVCALIAGAFLLPEGLAYWWMHPSSQKEAAVRMLSLAVPAADPAWKEKPEIYQSVQKGLKCSAGATGDFLNDFRQTLHLAYIEWNPDGHGAPIEAFGHLPESCMGHIGLTLEGIEARRIHPLQDGQKLVFDVTVFRKPGSMERIHVFKGLWIEGLDSADLRSGAFGGNHQSLRTYRLGAAKNRFVPAYSRVVMAAVEGSRSSDEAWHVFCEKVLVHLSLQDVKR